MQLELGGLKALIWLGAITGFVILGLEFAPGNNMTSVTVMVGFTSSVAVGILNLMRIHDNRIAADAEAQKVREALVTETAKVKNALSEHIGKVGLQLNAIENVGNTTHSLINSGYGLQLKAYMVLARRMADLSKDPEDEKVAKAAESVYQEYLIRQGKADAVPHISRGEG